MRAASVPLRPSGAASCPPATSAGQPTVCVCVPHSPAHFAGCAAREAGAGCGGGREGSPHATLRRRQWTAASSCVCVRPPGWRRARALEPKRCASQRNRKVCGRGFTSGRKIKQLVFQSQARRSRRHASRLGPEPLVRARLPHGARARPVKKKEKKAAARRAPTAEEAHRMHAGNPRSSKRHAAPRARAGGHATRSSSCGGEAGGGLGKWGGRWRGRCDVDHWLPAAPGARERRGAACADLLPDTFPPLPVNGCRFGREPASLAGGG